MAVYKVTVSLPEHLVEIADELLADHLAGDVVLSAPTTLPIELANALRYSGLPERVRRPLPRACGASAVPALRLCPKSVRTQDVRGDQTRVNAIISSTIAGVEFVSSARNTTSSGVGS